MNDDKRNCNSANSQRMIGGKLLAENLIYRLLNVAVVFVINILLSRLTGVSGYGLLSLLIANAGIFNLLSAFGADAGLTFHAASGGVSSRKLLSFLLLIVLFQILAVGLAEMATYFFTGHFLLLNTDDMRYWWAGILLMISLSLTEKYTALLHGQKLFSRSNRALLLSNMLMLVCFLIFFLNDKEIDVLLYIAVFVLLNMLQAFFLAATYHIISKNSFQPQKPGSNDVRLFFSYSVFSFVINVIQFLAYRVDYWLLNYYKGEEELGWYSLAVRLGQMFWVIPLLFAGIIFPVVAGKTADYGEEKLLSLVRSMNLMNIVTGLVVLLVAPFLIPFLFGNEYNNSVFLLQLLLPGVILFCIVTLLAAWFAGQKKLRINFVGSLICLAAVLTLDLALIPSMGMKGAAIASSIGYGLTAIYYISIYCYLNKIPVKNIFLWREKDWQYIRNIFRVGNK